MSTDARLSVGLPGHPKTKKLIRRLNASAGWSLVCLILWARANRPDGDLSGMSAEDIELAADWAGENDAFVRELASVGFLDGVEGGYQLHDWADHQPWSAGSDMRSLKAKWNAVKRHHGESEADRQVPEYARIRAANAETDAASNKFDASSNADSNDAAVRPASTSNAPSPSPSPSPSSGASSLRSDSQSPDETGDLLSGGNVHKHPTRQLPDIVLAAYHQLLPNCQRIVVLNPKRQKRVLAADKLARQLCKQLGWEYDADAFWRAYFEQCAADPWLRGDTPNPKNPRWKQNLDVLLAEDRFAQIMDQAVAALEAA